MLIDWPTDAAGWAALVTVAIVAAWKLYLRVRRDTRIDGHETLGRTTEVTVAGHYEQLLARMQAEITRIASLLEEERDARRAAETESTELRIRVQRLEMQVHALGATPHS